MTKPNAPINSIPDLNNHPSEWYGLTKREYFAAMAMQGILENKVPHYQLAEKAVTMADALIKELNESQPLIPIAFVDGKFTQRELDTFPINFHKWDELVDKIDIYIPHLWGSNPMSADGCSEQTQLKLLLTIAKKIKLEKAVNVLEQKMNQ